MNQQFMPGHVAIAESCYASGVEFGAGYPGFPCIEIIENLKVKEGIYCEWSTNEKVAFESAIGASLMGKRSVVSMKTVGLNVAADPFLAFSGAKVNGGFVIFACDDVGRLAGDDMNDSREYAFAADIPLIVPGDAQEAYDFLPEAFTLSEQFNTPVFFRLSSVVTHTGMVVNNHLTERYENTKGFDPEHYAYVPKTVTGTIATIDPETKLYKSMTRMYKDQPAIMKELAKWSNTTQLNQVEMNDLKLGFICSGTTYAIAKEVYPQASFLKIGMVHPLPDQQIRTFASQIDHLFVLEESKPLLEERVKALGIPVANGDLFPRKSEIFRLEPSVLRDRIDHYFSSEPLVKETDPSEPLVPYRLPVNCAGCSHRVVFYLLKKHGVKVLGDSGCYTLNLFPPMENIHNFICMGASIGLMHGYEKGNAFAQNPDKVVSVCGDGAFLHTGVNSLMNAAYNQGSSLYIILDNHGLAMTGGHGTPGNGQNANGAFQNTFDLERFCTTLGIRVIRVDPYDLQTTESALLESLNYEGSAVIIMDHPCERRHPSPPKKALRHNSDRCTGCQKCLQANCLALSRSKDTRQPHHNEVLCKACGICEDVCPNQAFESQ